MSILMAPVAALTDIPVWAVLKAAAALQLDTGAYLLSVTQRVVIVDPATKSINFLVRRLAPTRVRQLYATYRLHRQAFEVDDDSDTECDSDDGSCNGGSIKGGSSRISTFKPLFSFLLICCWEMLQARLDPVIPRLASQAREQYFLARSLAERFFQSAFWAQCCALFAHWRVIFSSLALALALVVVVAVGFVAAVCMAVTVGIASAICTGVALGVCIGTGVGVCAALVFWWNKELLLTDLRLLKKQFRYNVF